MPKPKPRIEDVATKFREAHSAEAKAKSEKEKWRKQFIDLLDIPAEELATQTIYYEGDDPEGYVAALYPKWQILKKELKNDEWRLVIQEDPDKKTYVFINPDDQYVYTRTVAESAPDVDLASMKEEDYKLYMQVTFEPPVPERELKDLSDLSEGQKDRLKRFLMPPKLTNRMEKPRKAKAEELEGL